MPYKLVVMGSCRVGKSALTIRFLQNSYVAEYEPITRDLYHGVVEVDGLPCELDVLDTGGAEEYYEQWEDFMRWGDGFLCVYAVDFMKTFVDVNLFRTQLQKVRGTSRVSMVLVANKIDKAHWLVDSDLGQEAGKSFNVPFMEASAKTGQGVKHAFHKLVPEIRLIRKEELKGRPWGSWNFGFHHCKIM